MRKQVSKRMALQILAAILLFCGAASLAVHAQSDKAPVGVLTGLSPGHISFSVEDIDRETDWYVKVFGCKVARSFTPNDEFAVRSLTMPGFMFDLVKQRGSKKASWPDSRYNQQGYVHLAFYTTDLPAALKALQDAKVEVVRLVKDDKGTTNGLIVRDPEGNELEVFTPPKY